MRFEEIDVVQQLEREVKSLELENQRVLKQRDDMNKFWRKVQELTELWLYRTTPRLDLVKELHSHLEDMDASGLISTITEVNRQLTDLEGKLGSIKDWQHSDDLD